VWPPVMKALDDRAKKVADGLAAADKAKADLVAVERRVQDELAKAKDVASDVRGSAEKQASALIDEARAEAAKSGGSGPRGRRGRSGCCHAACAGLTARRSGGTGCERRAADSFAGSQSSGPCGFVGQSEERAVIYG